MKKIKYHLFYKNDYYILLDLSDNTYVKHITFYSIYCYIKENKISFDSIGMPRMTLHKLFRDYCTFDNERSRI